MTKSDLPSGGVAVVHTPYCVLARKYRPATFSALIGQDVLVRTLTNAIKSGRVAHAYMLSGMRGVGKTTAARIFASALNCTGADGTGGPTVTPCRQCEHCRAISTDKHVDVLEMDAASRSSIHDIRELIESLPYKPASARYKIYILDEVHMLSHQAFTALLKSLEEPPEYVKFIFATTELHKVPVTILSRCQRFDLRRVDIETLVSHFLYIASQEDVRVEREALRLIAGAADGSVRDGLSLLDQAIAIHAGSKRITADGIREMLGLADQTLVLDLLDSLLRGDAYTALGLLKKLHDSGADPSLIIQEILVLVHGITRFKIVPSSSVRDSAVAEKEEDRSRAMATQLSIAVLARAWQMLLKALEDVRKAPSPIQAAEMALIRLAYAADLPTPLEIVSSFQKHSKNVVSTAIGPGLSTIEHPCSFPEVITLCRKKGEENLAFYLQNKIQPMHFEPGYIRFLSLYETQCNIAPRLAQLLKEWTGQHWVVSSSHEEERTSAFSHTKDTARVAGVAAHPLVKAVLETFPGARIHNASVSLSKDACYEENHSTTLCDDTEKGDML